MGGLPQFLFNPGLDLVSQESQECLAVQTRPLMIVTRNVEP
jgi:hypothetical protein